MPREIDDVWVEEAISAYRRIEERQESFARLLAQVEVSVRSPDELIEVVVGADGKVRGVTVAGPVEGRSHVELSRSIQAAITSAHDAAQWARQGL